MSSGAFTRVRHPINDLPVLSSRVAICTASCRRQCLLRPVEQRISYSPPSIERHWPTRSFLNEFLGVLARGAWNLLAHWLCQAKIVVLRGSLVLPQRLLRWRYQRTESQPALYLAKGTQSTLRTGCSDTGAQALVLLSSTFT